MIDPQNQEYEKWMTFNIELLHDVLFFKFENLLFDILIVSLPDLEMFYLL